MRKEMNPKIKKARNVNEEEKSNMVMFYLLSV